MPVWLYILLDPKFIIPLRYNYFKSNSIVNEMPVPHTTLYTVDLAPYDSRILLPKHVALNVRAFIVLFCLT